jgi:hypothetical protein
MGMLTVQGGRCTEPGRAFLENTALHLFCGFHVGSALEATSRCSAFPPHMAAQRPPWTMEHRAWPTSCNSDLTWPPS